MIVLNQVVDFKALDITMLAAHKSIEAEGRSMTSDIAEQISTARDSDVRLPKSKPRNHPDHIGIPTPASTQYWILTVWTSWPTHVAPYFDEEHSYDGCLRTCPHHVLHRLRQASKILLQGVNLESCHALALWKRK